MAERVDGETGGRRERRGDGERDGGTEREMGGRRAAFDGGGNKRS